MHLRAPDVIERQSRKPILFSSGRAPVFYGCLLLRWCFFFQTSVRFGRNPVSMADQKFSCGKEEHSGQHTSSCQTPDLWMLKWLQLRHQSLLDACRTLCQSFSTTWWTKAKSIRSEVTSTRRSCWTPPLLYRKLASSSTGFPHGHQTCFGHSSTPFDT